jgi:anti-sigma B factor antagonist
MGVLGVRMEDQDRMAAGPVMAVVALPAEIDVANRGEVRRDLTDALVSGADVVIADMTGTTFSDTMGVRELVLAHKLADTKGVQFRVVMSSPNLLRVLSVSRLDGYLSVYRTLEEALIADPGTGWPGRDLLTPR